jgi:hypothetical protein
MTIDVAHIAFDCADAARLAGFWSEVLGRPVADGAVKNRVHVDLTSPDWRAEVDRVLALGATKVAEFAEYGTEWATLRDPEGNRLANQR